METLKKQLDGNHVVGKETELRKKVKSLQEEVMVRDKLLAKRQKDFDMLKRDYEQSKKNEQTLKDEIRKLQAKQPVLKTSPRNSIGAARSRSPSPSQHRPSSAPTSRFNPTAYVSSKTSLLALAM